MGTSKGQKKQRKIRIQSLPIIILLAFISSSCLRDQSESTQVKLLNNTRVSDSLYVIHKQMLTDSIRKFISARELAYYPEGNDAKTEIYLDTILYSPDITRLAFFVVTGNTNDKLPTIGSKTKFHYDGYCFIANIRSDSIVENIQWVNVMTVSNYSDLDRASNRLRDMYFNELSRIKDVDASSKYKYNISERGFWNGPIWGN